MRAPEARAKKFWIFRLIQFLCQESYLPGRAGKSKKLPARLKICLPGAGGQAVVSNTGHIIAGCNGTGAVVLKN